MATINEVEMSTWVIAYVFSLVFWGLPWLLLAAIGWWLSKRVKNQWGRACIGGALISMAFAPTEYGHAGLAPAIFAVFFPPIDGKTDWAAIAALVAGWLIAFGFMVRVERGSAEVGVASA